MKATNTIMRVLAVSVIVLAMSVAEARAAVTVYADEIPSNGAVAVSAPAVAQTNGGETHGGNPQVRIDETGVHIGGPNPVDINAPAWTGHNNVVASIVAILGSFGLPVLIIAIVFYSKNRRNRMAHETLRMMIEKGVPITPELVANLRGNNCGGLGGDRSGWTRSGRIFPGLVLTGIGAAILITGSRHDRGGWIVLFIGIAFLIAWMVERKGVNDTQPPR